MPMIRYEIRNEYSLADPELFRAADKDDPEALLEGVAMAGLVGVLRQLGDLAEFAAEIFHNLHEEVMATAARGHGLMIRVQQLETEVPSIERAFLSQTDHSSFFYHSGVDCHPNLRIDQNLVAQGDLPRFIMNSYEECRAPPRLFLLDKFDVAGAGACLKRYTDPSLFKVETSGMTSADVQREKKIRKTKKKGPRWRNGETPEVLPTSHAKLHQLFLEERVENGVSNHSHRAKLKRRLNGFPFDSKTGKSYMEKLLKSPSPDHKVLHEVTVSSSPLLAPNDHAESGPEVLEARPVSPDRESVGRKRSPPSSPDREEIMLNPSMYEPSEVPVEDKIWEIPNSYPSIATDGISSTLDKVIGEKVIAVDAESNREGSLTGYQSDGIVSEVDNYVDAPSTMDSEMDTDYELRLKSSFTASNIKNQPLISDANEEHPLTRSSDSQSTGYSTISDEGNNSSGKEMSSCSSSDSPSTSAENPQSEKFSARGCPSADIPEIEIVDTSYQEKPAGEDFPVDQHSKPVVSDDICTDADAITNHRSDFEQLTSSLCWNESTPTLATSDSGGVVSKGMLKGTESDEMTQTLVDEQKKTNLVVDPPYSSSVSDFESQSGDDSPRSSAGQLVDEPNGVSVPCISAVPDIFRHTTDSSVAISLDLQHEDESDREDQNLVENAASTSNMFNVLSQKTNGTPEMLSSENLILGKLDDESAKLPENILSDNPDIAHNGDNINSTVPKGENLIDDLDTEDSNVSINAPNHFSYIMEDSLGKKSKETSSAYTLTVDAEDNHSNNSIDNQISSENMKMSHPAYAPDWPGAGIDAQEDNFNPEEETTLHETPALGMPKSCEVVGLQGTGMTDHISPNDSEALESSYSTQEDLEERAGTSHYVEKDGISRCMSSTGPEVTEICGSVDLKPLNEVHVLLDEPHSEVDESNAADMGSAVPAVSENAIIENDCLPVVLDKLVEEQIHGFEDTDLDEIENGNCLSGSYGESGLVEKEGQTKAATSGLETFFCNTVNNDHLKSEVSDAVPNSHLDLEVEHSLEFVHAASSQSLVEQSNLDTEKEFFQPSGLENHVSDSPSFRVDYDAEESIVQQKIWIPPGQLDQELLHSGAISSELSPLLPTNHQQMLNHDDSNGNNGSAFTFSLVCFQDPPSVSELPRLSHYNIDVPGYPKDPSGSIFPPSNPFSGTNQINLDELPPLPPLPPVQWRMGKLQHVSCPTEGETMKHKEFFPQLIYPPTASTDDIGSCPPTASTDDVNSYPPTTSTDDVGSYPPTTSTDDAGSSQPIASTAADAGSSRPTASTDNIGSSPLTATPDDAGSYPPTASTDEAGSSQLTTSTTDAGSASTADAGSSPPTATTDDVSSLVEEMKHSLIQITSETASKEEKVEENSCSGLETNVMHETIELPPKIENKQQQFVMPTLEGEFTSPAEEDGVANGSRTVKLPRARNPLIDDVAVLDKSKLRKVTERVRPQIHKVDERDSLLEQIRTKSFNLKPAMASRPSIRGPNTNLRVAAILEKANSIRQALAGSDEDDDDNWSDS